MRDTFERLEYRVKDKIINAFIPKQEQVTNATICLVCSGGGD